MTTLFHYFLVYFPGVGIGSEGGGTGMWESILSSNYDVGKYLGNNKFSSEKADRWQSTVHNQGNGRPGIYNWVYIRKPFKPLQPASIAIPDWTVFAQKNFNRSKGPSKNLIKAIREIDWCWSFECRPLGHTVHRPPTMAVHLKSCQDVLGYRAIYPANLIQHRNLGEQESEESIYSQSRSSPQLNFSFVTSFPHSVLSS